MVTVPAFGQATSGTILGTVQDPSGAAVPDATVTVRNTGTSDSKIVKTDQHGSYAVTYLIPGKYDVVVERTGFTRFLQAGIDLQVDQKARVDVTMQVGSVNQTVEVTTGAPLIQTDSSEQAQVINARQITTLPLNVRNFAQLLTLTSGTQPGDGQGSSISPDNPQGLSATIVNGLPNDSNNWQIDGMSDNEAFFNILTVNPSIDAIQEFKVSTSNYSAEFGRAGGANVQISIKSGTNNFHGVAFEFLRNSALDANGFFSNKYGSPIPAFKQNQFGGNLGGPIIKNRTFFFADYEGYRSRTGETELMTVPTALQRQGIFTEVDPTTGAHQQTIYNPTTRQPYVNNTIPTSQIDPVSANILKLLPAPNLAAPNGQQLLSNNYFGQDTLAHDVDQGDVRVDHRFSDKNQFFGRYSILHTTLSQPPFLGTQAGGDPFLAALSDSKNQNAMLSDVHSFTPTVLNEFRMGINRVNLNWAAFDASTNTSANVGIPGINDFCGFCGGLARIGISGLSTFGHTPYAPTYRHDTIFEWVDNMTIVKGKQTIKVGADINRLRANLFQTSNPVGEFDFDQNMTSNGQTGGTGLASFLTGYYATASRDAMTGYPSYRTTELFFFGQDDIRVNEKLTLNLGLRYEIYTAVTDAYNRQANFDLASGDLLQACVATSCSGGVRTNYGNWEPRVGFAYSPDHSKTAVRGAFGISTFAPGSGGQLGSLGENPPWEQGQYFTPPTPITPGPTINQGLPGLPPLVARPGAPAGHYIATGSHVIWVDPNLKMSKVYQWSFDMQRTIIPNLLVDAAYVGNSLNGLYLNVPGNYVEPGQDLINPSTGLPLSLQQRRPYYSLDPDLQGFTRRFNAGHSDYHSLQLKVEKRFSSGLSFLGAYTWSKTLVRGQNFIDPGNYMTKALANQDMPQRLVISYTYELPVGRSKRFGQNLNRWENAAVGGWQLQGITTFYSGLPFTPTIQSYLDNGSSNIPNRIGSGTLPNPTINDWFNTAAFTQPGNTYGNTGYSILRGPGGRNWDMSLFKNFVFTEARYLQFRAEFFNAFNNVNFGKPNLKLCGGTCGEGTITSQANTPRQIQFALKLYF